MPYIMVDVESDGPIPGDYSMISFGAVVVEPTLSKTFYGRLKPISDKWVPEALEVSGHSREETMGFEDPKKVMELFGVWLMSQSFTSKPGSLSVVRSSPMFVSDNNGFDWQFINWYFHHFTGSNPFGFSSTNLGSLYKGMVKNTRQNFKHLRKTKHTHHPVQDAIGNAEAMLHMISKMGLKTSNS